MARPNFPTANAERLMGLDRFIAEYVLGDLPHATEAQFESAKVERRKLIAHFDSIRHCPTCGHPLPAKAVVARPHPASV